MRRKIAAATLAATVTVGGLGAAALAVPTLAGAAAESATRATGWVQGALGGLVQDGTITQEQADAVAAALRDARPEPPEGGPAIRRGGGPLDLSAVAGVLGLSEDELREALGPDTSLADLAAERGVDVQAVVDAVVDAQEARVAEAVEAGRLTQEQADEILAGAEERATALVNGERPPKPEGAPEGGFGRGGGPGRLGALDVGPQAPDVGPQAAEVGPAA